MVFIYILSFIALSLAVVSGIFSIIGLASTIPSLFVSMIAMGVVLEAGKLGGVSYIYRYYSHGPKWLSYLIGLLSTGLLVVTMTGHYGYLSKGYQQDYTAQKQITSHIQSFEIEKERKIARKKEIDTQIAQIDAQYVTARIKLSKQFDNEQKQLDSRINELDVKMADLKSNLIDVQSHSGTIIVIANSLGITDDSAMKWFIILIVILFDPMALALTIAVNVMILHRKVLETQSHNDIKVSKPIIKRKRKQKSGNLFERIEEVPLTKEEQDKFNFTVKNPYKPSF